MIYFDLYSGHDEIRADGSNANKDYLFIKIIREVIHDKKYY
jgi:hypothetical protein